MHTLFQTRQTAFSHVNELRVFWGISVGDYWGYSAPRILSVGRHHLQEMSSRNELQTL